jgi:hypothetical protein
VKRRTAEGIPLVYAGARGQEFTSRRNVASADSDMELGRERGSGPKHAESKWKYRVV